MIDTTKPITKVKYGNTEIPLKTLNLQEKNVTPSTSAQTVEPDNAYGGLSQVNVSAVTSDIDANITPNNIKLGVSILGVQGNIEPDKPDQTKTVSPTTSQQVVTPDTGYELASVTVNAVTSNIDANIQPENIKKDTTILGVTGTLEIALDEQEKTVTPTTSVQEVEPDEGKVLSKVTVNAIQTETATVKSGATQQTITPTAGKFIDEVTVQAVTSEVANVTPSTSAQTITPTSDYISQVNVGAVTSAIDPNIVSTNIKAGVTILGVQGNVEPDKPDQSKTVTPTTSQQTITADIGYELASVTVNAIQTEQKTIEPTTSVQTVTPTQGKFIDEVTVNAVDPSDYYKTEETATVTPTGQQQIVNPTSGNVFSSVTVNAIPSNYKDTTNTDVVAGDILAGKVAVNGSGEVTGTIQTYSGSTSITPTEQAQALGTQGKYIASDITVGAIPSNYEDVTAEVTAQNAIVDEIERVLQGQGGGGDNVAYAKQMDLIVDVIGQRQIVERDYAEAEMTKLENVLINLTQGVEVNG